MERKRVKEKSTVFYTPMKNFWMINPKYEGTGTDLKDLPLDSVYMGWDATNSPKFYNDVKKVTLLSWQKEHTKRIKFILLELLII